VFTRRSGEVKRTAERSVAGSVIKLAGNTILNRIFQQQETILRCPLDPLELGSRGE
jgi:hypothetical protein